MRTTSYQNFDLLIEKIGDKCRVHVIGGPCKGGITEFVWPPFSKEELSLLPAPTSQRRNLGYEDPLAHTPCLTPKQFGERLYNTVFGKEIADCFARSLKKVWPSGLRVRLQFEKDAELAELPWEYLYDPKQKAFLALSSLTPVVRNLNLAEAESIASVKPPLRILVILANPDPISKLDVEKEWKDLERALAELKKLRWVELTRLTMATLDELEDQLRKAHYDILHFIGHGRQGALLFADREVTGEDLAYYFKDNKPRLIFLNACETGAAPENDPVGGVAQQLVERGFPAVIAMQSKITDTKAIRLSQEFYEAVAAGYPVDAALAEARLALYGSQDQMEWGTPVLYSTSDTNELIDLSGPLPKPWQDFEPETVMIPAGDFWMGSERSEDIANGDWKLHQVMLPEFAIGKYPVTNVQYARFVQEPTQHEHRPRAARWSYVDPPEGEGDHPVVGITWADALAYCEWLSKKTGRTYRLPTEAEWEKAARGDQDMRRYPWPGNELTSQHCNCGGSGTTSVDSHPQGVSPYGCYDMLGNVYEWTCTAWGDNQRQTRTSDPMKQFDRQMVSAKLDVFCVCRGGVAYQGAKRVGCSVRRPFPPCTRNDRIGFRVVQEMA